MEAGRFSFALAVKDIAAAWAFYEKLGFKILLGKVEDKWLVIQNGAAIFSLHQGGIDKNTLTFNPTDVRAIQKELKSKNVPLTVEADESTTGPAYITLADPDGNPILFDQH
ncbi:MAG: VOC family protein [Anaerolineae bacterium]|nr:VOC family protein [Anaerolineae bacterium]